MSPTAPSGDTSAIQLTAGAAFGPMDVNFPPRNEVLDFRNRLEAKYRDQLGRPPIATFVDPEGDVVWTQEYLRYRTNLCDHATAVQRVFAQIDGNGPGDICGSTVIGPVVAFPPRNETLEFRRALEQKYQDIRHGLSQTYVDQEGSVIWTAEYLRYRASGCDHETAVRNVFAQIDGGPIAPLCAEPCRYTLAEARQSVPSFGGNFSTVAFRRAGDCSWTASTDAAFIRIDSASGGSAELVRYGVSPNNTSAARTGTIRIDWPGGSTELVVQQSAGGAPFGLTLFDPARSSNPVTECEIRSAATQCVLRVTSALAVPIINYKWEYAYAYGVAKSFTQNGGDTLTFTEVCGQPGSSSDGIVNILSVTLQVTDSDGTVYTVTSGADGQPVFSVKFFTC